MKKYICFDVGGTKVKYGLLLENGTVLSNGSYNTRPINLELFLKDMIDTINMYTSNTIVSGIAISLPGFINPHTGYSEAAGSVKALSKQNLKELLKAKTSLPIEIENDGNCAALAESISGNAKNCTDFICITLGTGVGGGIFTNGKLLRGHSFRGGEFGFMKNRAKRGQFELWHSNASTSALIHSYKKLKGLSENENIDGETVFLDSNNNHSVRKLIDDWIKNISYGIYNLTVTLNPQKVLIGGGVANQQELLSMINHQLDRITWWKVFKVPVELCKYQNDAGMIGALYHFLQEQTRPFK
ncbi:ROK family protein [Neobacillus sp. SuZ13]|uniref:ROK family protein n=1 Tax=Neobacillus sp. SuZ13 TaxID=3047875 RepID=UPI0024C02426|nr:ROK family protein [Neobacillus sp. SuZ13]WHY69741.1 ROK family protein [Neobacillus sp. SuZ13]